MQTQTASNNTLQLGLWKDMEFNSDFDLSHVNEALIQHKSKAVHGTIADVLMKEEQL
jgi:hypothetical protein